MRIKTDNKGYYNLKKEKTVNIYFCGPTVYNHVHIGNIRPIIIGDSLVKFLREKGYVTKFVHNITDIDDKIIKASISSNVTEEEISKKFTSHYQEILSLLNVNTIDSMPNVTSNIEGIIKYISKMLESKKAYISNGNVYFDIKTVSDIYGKISGRKIEDLIETENNDHQNEKRNPQDFVLWKNTNEGITWKTPWSSSGGRPGWHTECCYFIEKEFGESIDIHGGGIDLIFPHHENENAQFYSLTNKPIANSWMHNGHITVDDQKMSKSLNNFVLAKDILQRYQARVVRWFFLSNNYSKPMNYSTLLLDNSKNELEKIDKIIVNSLIELIRNRNFKVVKTRIEEFDNQINDNFNTANAITSIWENIKHTANLIRSKKWEELNQLINSVFNCLKSIGIYQDINITEESIHLIDELYESKSNSNFEESDRILKKLFDSKLVI